MHSQHEHILVCVTGQRNCERLIRQSAQLVRTLSLEKKCEISVIHVTGGSNRFMGNEDEGAALEYLFQISKAYGASMTVKRNEDPVGTIASFADFHRVTRIVLGISLTATAYDFTSELKKRMPGTCFHVIPYDVGGRESENGQSNE